ncbi:hypothetical protein PAXRUDRAFT_784436 [Paxillus rubicundulus Ve08.2h10]|uniref:DUF6533 domain-containing protein n=1 Tax=Paxillus rubicundulus Ve08.2h10 TaxID=930991 RepID=A0A0D0DAK7_9AGAM|nr:hypothetical protein PAXRUDRAFT_784436 [Paxillus rubicundulus Ve08.2h10]
MLSIEDEPSAAQVIRDASIHCFASLVLLVWDMLITYEAEIEHIWSKPRSSFFKWLYLYLRYFNLLVQISHQVAIPVLTNGENHAPWCTLWYAYAVVISQVSISAVEVILAIRVFALFNKSYHIACVLAILVVAEMVTMAVYGFYTIPEIRPSDTCIFTEPPKEILNYSVVCIVTQSILLGLACFKHFIGLRSGWGRTPLVSLLVRDGSAVYVVMLAFVMAIVAFCKLEDERTVVMFFWLISLSSVSGCRLIVNAQMLGAAPRRTRFSEVILFTTEDELEVELPCLTMSSAS